MIITNNSPGAGFVAWQDVVIKHKNISYTIDNGNSDKKYIWWDFSTPTVLQTTNTMPTMTDNDAIIIYNDSGTYHLWGDWKIHGGLIILGTVPLTALETPPYVTGQFIFTVTRSLIVENNATLELMASATLTLTEVFISVKTAPTGANIIVDVNKNGTTIFTDQGKRPEIVATETSDTSDEPDVTSVVKDDILTIDIDQIGSGEPGEDLTVHLRFTQLIV